MGKNPECTNYFWPKPAKVHPKLCYSERLLFHMLGTALCEPQSYPIPLLSGEGGIENEITEVV